MPATVNLNGFSSIGPCGNGGVCQPPSRWNHAAVPEEPEVGKADNPCPNKQNNECGCETNGKVAPEIRRSS